MALIERGSGFTVGTVEDGHLSIGATVQGNLREPGRTIIWNEPDDTFVTFLVEAEALSEEEANELLGFVRDASAGQDDAQE